MTGAALTDPQPTAPLTASGLHRLKRLCLALALCALAACTAGPTGSVPTPPPVLAAGCPARQFAVLPVMLARGSRWCRRG